MPFLLSLLEGAFSLWQSFKANANQQIGKLTQQRVDDKASLKTAKDASRLSNEVGGDSESQLDNKLAGRMRDPCD